MKASEPGTETHGLKYGLPVSEQHRIVERHFVVNLERNLIRDLHWAQAARAASGLAAALASVES